MLRYQNVFLGCRAISDGRKGVPGPEGDHRQARRQHQRIILHTSLVTDKVGACHQE